jgi:hypothetical protein
LLGALPHEDWSTPTLARYEQLFAPNRWHEGLDALLAR